MSTQDNAENTPPGADASMSAAPETETPAEGAEGAEPIVEAAPVEGEPAAEKTPEELAAEVAAKADEDAKFAADLPTLLKKIPEPELRKLGLKFANGTMAAARRAERAVETVTRENAELKRQIASRTDGPSLRDKPAEALRAAGFASIREFVDHLVDAGADKQPTADDKVTALEKKIRERDEAEQKAHAERLVEASKTAVAGAIGKDKTRWALTSGRIGQRELWGAIEAYQAEHGTCPDEAVYALADETERTLRADLNFSPPDAANPAAAKGAPAPAARTNAGKTLTGKGSSGPPVVRGFDPEESDEARRARVQREMREAGELS